MSVLGPSSAWFLQARRRRHNEITPIDLVAIGHWDTPRSTGRTELQTRELMGPIPNLPRRVRRLSRVPGLGGIGPRLQYSDIRGRCIVKRNARRRAPSPPRVWIREHGQCGFSPSSLCSNEGRARAFGSSPIARARPPRRHDRSSHAGRPKPRIYERIARQADFCMRPHAAEPRQDIA